MTEALFALAGILIGYGLAERRFDQLFRLAARYHRSGDVQVFNPPPAGEREDRVTGSPEANAARQVLEDAVKRGADQVMASYQEQGIPITRRQAEEEARSLFMDAQPLGGAK